MRFDNLKLLSKLPLLAVCLLVLSGIWSNVQANDTIRLNFLASGNLAPSSNVTCQSCHNAAAGSELASNATGPLAAEIKAQVAPKDFSSAFIQNKINALFAPAFSGAATMTLNKSAVAGATVGSVSISNAPGLAFRSGELPGAPAGYQTQFRDITAGFGATVSGGTFTVTLQAPSVLRNNYGSLPVTLRAKSSEGLICQSGSCGSKTINITLINNPPALSNTTYANAVSSTPATVQLVASDPDGDTVTFSNLVNTGATGTASAVSSTGLFTYTAPAGITGAFSAAFSVDLKDDPAGAATTATFVITANAGSNAAPVAQDGSFTVTEDTPFNGTLPATDTDPLTFSPLGSTPLPHGTVIVNADGTFTYTPKLNDTLGDTFTYTATDTFGVSDTGTLTFNVTPVNDLPTVVANATETVNQVTDVPGTLSKDLNTLVTDVDTPAAQRQFAFVSMDNDRAGTVTIAPNGTLNFTARPNWAGVFTVAYSVTDEPGNPARVVNGLLRIAVLLNNNAGHDQPGGVSIAQVTGSLASRYSPYFSNSEPQACLNCHVNGRVTEPAPDCNTSFFTAYGAALCRVKPFDPNFAERLALVASQFEPSVTNAPGQAIEVIENAPVGTKIGTPLSFNAGKNLDGQASTIVTTRLASSAPADAASYFALDASGQITVAKSLLGVPQTLLTIYPQPVNDASQRSASGSIDPARQGGFFQPAGTGATVSILVRRLAPVVADDTYQTNTDTSLPLDLDVTANDTAGGPIDTLVDVTQPAGGTVTIVGKKLRFVSDGVTTGAVTFTYRAERTGVGVSDTAATVTITVFGAGAAVAQPDGPYDIVIGETLSLPVQANDRGPKPFSGFALVAGSSPTRGTAVIAGDAIDYTATSEGTDVFKYQVTAGGVTTEAAVTVRVGKVSGTILEAATNNPALKPVARALGDTCRDIGRSGGALTEAQTDLSGICNALVDQASTVGAIDHALDQIRNEETLVVGDNAQGHDRASANNIFGRLDAIRNGKGRGLNFSQFGLKVDNVNISGSLIDAVIHKASDDDASGGKGDLPWGVFLAGTLNYATQSDSSQDAGFDMSGIMLTAGLDYKLSDSALIGLAISGGQIITDIGGGSTLASQSFQLAGYGSFELTNNLFLDGYAGLARNRFDMSRSIAFTSGPSSVDRSALANFNGDAFSAAGRLKYVADLGEADLETYMGLNYLKVWTDSYVEGGAGGLNLVVGKQNFETLAGTVGMRISQPFDIETGRVKPYLGLSYSRQLISDKRSVASRFAAGLPGSPSFLVSTEGEGQNFGTIELGLQADFFDRSSASFDVSGTFSDEGFAGYQAKLGVDIPLGYIPPPAAEPEPKPVRKQKTKPTTVANEPTAPKVAKPRSRRPPTAAPDSNSSGDGSSSSSGSGWGG